MKELFDQTKKIYTSDAFLSAEDLKLDLPEQRAIIRKVNLATFVSSVFGSKEVGFFHLNECFLDTFVPDGGRLLKSQGALYLDLKTQAFISALATGDRGKTDILNDLFPEDMASRLLARRPGAKGLTPSESDFVQRALQRKSHLMHLPEDTALSEKYVWQDFLQDVSSYVSKHFDTIMAQPIRKNRKRQYATTTSHKPSTTQIQPVYTSLHQQPTMEIPIQPMHNSIIDAAQTYYQPQQPLPQNGNSDSADHAQSPHHHTPPNEDIQHNQQPLGVAESFNNLQQPTEQPSLQNQESRFEPAPEAPASQSLSPPPQQLLHQLTIGSSAPMATMQMNLGIPPAAPQQAQTTPTQVLYERARLAAQSKASPNARRSGLPSQRRPWTPEEETALMAGLDRVKGPHWSQILAMFGPGGSINEVLKDRNQVQLKDKARNLKLFFLKSGIEVPYYLQFVTGELKTRAPSQALKQQKLKAQLAARDAGLSQDQYQQDQSSDDENESPANESESAARAANRAQAQALADSQIAAVQKMNSTIDRQNNMQHPPQSQQHQQMFQAPQMTHQQMQLAQPPAQHQIQPLQQQTISQQPLPQQQQQQQMTQTPPQPPAGQQPLQISMELQNGTQIPHQSSQQTHEQQVFQPPPGDQNMVQQPGQLQQVSSAQSEQQPQHPRQDMHSNDHMQFQSMLPPSHEHDLQMQGQHNQDTEMLDHSHDQSSDDLLGDFNSIMAPESLAVLGEALMAGQDDGMQEMNDHDDIDVPMMLHEQKQEMHMMMSQHQHQHLGEGGEGMQQHVST